MKQIIPDTITLAISREGGRPIVTLSGRRTNIEDSDGERLPDQTYSKQLGGEPEYDAAVDAFLSATYARLKSAETNSSVSITKTVTTVVEV